MGVTRCTVRTLHEFYNAKSLTTQYLSSITTQSLSIYLLSSRHLLVAVLVEDPVECGHLIGVHVFRGVVEHLVGSRLLLD